MDPIYHYLNRKPSHWCIRYIDDNTIPGPGNGEWVMVFKGVTNAVVQIDAHSCWQAVSSACRPFCLQALVSRHECEAIVYKE